MPAERIPKSAALRAALAMLPCPRRRARNDNRSQLAMWKEAA